MQAGVRSAERYTMDLRVQFQHSESTFPTLIWSSNGPTNQDHLNPTSTGVRSRSQVRGLRTDSLRLEEEVRWA